MNPMLKLRAFGVIESTRLLAFGDLFAVIQDKFPVSGRTLIIVRRPVTRFQELTSAEKPRLLVWIDWTQQHVTSLQTPALAVFNLSLNDGPAAGHTVPQLHFHVIPRFTGDIPDHRGGNPQRNPIGSTLLKRRGRAVTVAGVFLALAP